MDTNNSVVIAEGRGWREVEEVQGGGGGYGEINGDGCLGW